MMQTRGKNLPAKAAGEKGQVAGHHPMGQQFDRSIGQSQASTKEILPPPPVEEQIRNLVHSAGFFQTSEAIVLLEAGLKDYQSILGQENHSALAPLFEKLAVFYREIGWEETAEKYQARLSSLA